MTKQLFASPFVLFLSLSASLSAQTKETSELEIANSFQSYMDATWSERHELVAAPFRPDITFTYIPVPHGVNKKSSPPMIVHVVNSGTWPVWYSGKDGQDGQVVGFTYRENPNDDCQLGISDKWNKLSAGECAVVRVSSQSLYDHPWFEVDFQDWRGREATCSSQVFDLQRLNNFGAHGNTEDE